jgi:hypothetical protein
MHIAVKVLLWGVVVATVVPLIGVLLFFGMCLLNAR